MGGNEDAGDGTCVRAKPFSQIIDLPGLLEANGRALDWDESQDDSPGNTGEGTGKGEPYQLSFLASNQETENQSEICEVDHGGGTPREAESSKADQTMRSHITGSRSWRLFAPITGSLAVQARNYNSKDTRDENNKGDMELDEQGGAEQEGQGAVTARSVVEGEEWGGLSGTGGTEWNAGSGSYPGTVKRGSELIWGVSCNISQAYGALDTSGSLDGAFGAFGALDGRKEVKEPADMRGFWEDKWVGEEKDGDGDSAVRPVDNGRQS
ncbi:hypothetical protein DFH09DRAFT_1088868 [Mycena vulgaris]|nr:hypothetical protein DFH09DRAFT_1088868 [Mycena vulgaris]